MMRVHMISQEKSQEAHMTKVEYGSEAVGSGVLHSVGGLSLNTRGCAGRCREEEHVHVDLTSWMSGNT